MDIVETGADNMGNSDVVDHHKGLDNHWDHPDMDQPNDLIYHPGMGEVEVVDEDSYHPSGDDFEEPIDLGWGNPGQEYSSPFHKTSPVPQGNSVHYPVVEGMT